MVKIAVIGLVGKSMFFDVPHFHSGGETVHSCDYYEEWGGKGFNQAVAAARQGASVSFLGMVGCEADAQNINKFCLSEGIKPVIRISQNDTPTACAAILTDGTGETRVTVYRGAELTVDDVEKSFKTEIAEADYLLLNNEVPQEVNIRASEIAESYSVKIIYNPAPARQLDSKLASRVSLFTPNEFEEASLPEVNCEVITTLGSKGCRIRSTGEVIPSPKVKAVDSTGAGDTFNATLAVRLAEGEVLSKACYDANIEAAKSVGIRFVMPSLPHRGS
jgi:ribokinase